MERDVYRNDDYQESKVWYSFCYDCGWEDGESYPQQGDCVVTQCPDCGSDHIGDEEEFV